MHEQSAWKIIWNHFILQVGTNDLSTERSPELIAKSTVDLETTLESGSRNVSVSNINHCTYWEHETEWKRMWGEFSS